MAASQIKRTCPTLKETDMNVPIRIGSWLTLTLTTLIPMVWMAGKTLITVINTTKMTMARTPPGARDGGDATRPKKSNQKKVSESHQRVTTLLISEVSRLSEPMDKETQRSVLRTTTPQLAVIESSY